MKASKLIPIGIFCVLLHGGASLVAAQVITATFDDFELERWMDVGQTDGGVTIHRLRVTTQRTGFRSWGAETALNRDYMQRLGVQVEFTNEGSRKVKSYITVRLLDASGEAVDGFGDEEGLDANRARGVVERSFPASKYGLKRVERLELEVKLSP
jgi:hypothetical protein